MTEMAFASLSAFKQWRIDDESFEVRFDDRAREPFRSVFGGLLAGLAANFAQKDAHCEHPLVAETSQAGRRTTAYPCPIAGEFN
jgi:hypothetical protein